ncbi:MAG: 2-phosphosulfolactate phosphatase [Candidatus Eisenbacteria bacterium]|nr:2-phosphosulfolactate phosphatase [Candidatus Eisenbacteria bacterium]
MELNLYTRAGELPEGNIKGTHVVVIDVLRASSTMVQACENGVERIIPVAGVEDATRLAPTLEKKNALLGGERDGRMIEGFDLGNSPLEYTSKAVKGKTLVLSTSNGTVAITQSAAAKELIVGCFLNLGAVVAHVLSSRPKKITLLCAGNQGRLSLEDLVCGGLMVRKISESFGGKLVLNDGALAGGALAGTMTDIGEVVRESSHGRLLAELGFEADLDFCSRIDRSTSVPVVVDGRISGEDACRR